MRILFILFLSSFPGCSTWRQGVLPPFFSWSEKGDRLASVQVKYDEKDSWNPMMGTTDKRSYKTDVKIYKLESGKLSEKPVEEKSLDSWVLPGSFYYSDTGDFFAVLGSPDSGFGTESKIFSYFKSLSSPAEVLWKFKDTLNLEKAVPSPDKSKAVLILSSSSQDGTLKFSAELLDLKSKSSVKTDLPGWFDSPEHRAVWEKDSSSVYFRIKDKVYSLSEKTAFKPVLLFPECFLPETSFGDSVGAEGIQAEYSMESQSVKISSEKVKDYKPFEKIRPTSSLKNCR